MDTGTGKVVLNRAMSLDGFIAGPGDDIGWIRALAPQEDAAEVAAATGSMLIGRRTWDVGRQDRGRGAGQHGLSLHRAVVRADPSAAGQARPSRHDPQRRHRGFRK
jgi:dihydrofolate reductase